MVGRECVKIGRTWERLEDEETSALWLLKFFIYLMALQIELTVAFNTLIYEFLLFGTPTGPMGPSNRSEC